MRAISGLVVPTAGEVMFDGKAITTYEAHRITEAGILQVPASQLARVLKARAEQSEAA